MLDALAAVRGEKPADEPRRLVWHKVRPGDPTVPQCAHLLMHAIAERIRWRAEYDKALLVAAGEQPPDLQQPQPEMGHGSMRAALMY